MVRAAFLLSSVLALLAGCGGAAREAAAPEPVDAAVSDALSDPIMTDPDLVSQNQAYAAVMVSGPVNSALPPIDRSDTAIAAARDAAMRLSGTAMPAVPEPSPGDLKPLQQAVTAAQIVAAAKVASSGCSQDLQYSASWAATLAAPFEVYPRGAVVEAAGAEAGSCALRVVRFKTPVAPDDVMALHHARLQTAGYVVQHSAEGAGHLLRGHKGRTNYAIYLRKAEDGLTSVDIVVAGS